VPERYAVLTEDAEAGDRIIKINAVDWKAVKIPAIAFDVKQDLSDLPNNNSQRISNIEVKDDITEISLRKPLQKSFKKGTPVRQHIYQDPFWLAVEVKPSWQEYSIFIGGESERGRPDRKKINKVNKVWHGTEYIQVIILTNMGKKKSSKTYTRFLIDDISFCEIKYPGE